MNKIPLIVFAIMVALFLVPLLKEKNPAIIDSALVGKPVPGFRLPPALKDKPGFTPKDLQRETVIVNFFASWCIECVAEQEALAAIGLPVYGIAYKDTASRLELWLRNHGDPFTALVADVDGRAGIDWGVTGVPETFIIDKGVIRARIVGAATVEKLVAELQK